MQEIKIVKTEKDEIIGRMKTFYYEMSGDEIGDLAAEHWFEFMKKEVGPFFYNKGIEDSKQMLMEKMLHLEEDLYALKRPLQTIRK